MSLQTVEIDHDNLEDAVALLDKGFPMHGPSFWRSMILRIKQLHRNQALSGAGQMLLKTGRPIGILLRIKHHCPLSQRLIINLSSWYIEPEFRAFAPNMLLKATADKTATYTDFTPSSEVLAINERLGFKTIHSHSLLFALPWTALTKRSRAKVLPYSNTGHQAQEEELAQFLNAHVDHMIVVHIDDGHEMHPVIFQRRRLRGIPVAKLIYCKDLRVLLKHSGAISRYLLGQGIFMMSTPAPLDSNVKGAIRSKKIKPIQVKGQWLENSVDQTYSETILLPYLT